MSDEEEAEQKILKKILFLILHQIKKKYHVLRSKAIMIE